MAQSKTLSIKLSLNDKQFQSSLKKSMRSMKKFGNNMKSLGRTISTGLTLPIIAFGAASVKAFDEQIKAETKLRTALGDSAEAFDVLKKQAQDLQKITIFGDEATLEAQSFLAQLGLNADAILRLTPLIQDFATAQGIQLTDAAKLVAKSVGSSTNALSRYGLQIEGTVGEQDRLESAVNALTKAFGGQSEAIAKEGLGPLQQLKNELGDVSEKFGEIVLEFIDPLTKGLEKISDALSGLTKEQKENIVQYVAIVAAVGPVLIIFGSLVTTITALIPLFTAIAGAVSLSAAPFIAIAAAVGYFIKRIVDLQNEYEEYNKVVGDFEPIAPFVPTPTTPTAPAIQRSTIPERIEPIKALSVALKELKTDFETLKPIVEDFEEGLSGMDIVANEITQTFKSFGNVFQSVFAQALQSQEGFFKSFVEGTKRALKALAAQIASILILNALLGGTSLGNLLGFKDIGGFRGIGQVLGGVGSVDANSVGVGGSLRSMMNTGGGVEVFGTLRGADIILSSDRARNNRTRTRGY
jgi:hypothetical protein